MAHRDDLGAADAVVLPGGFAHGDHLRTGAIARFSPVMRSVEAFAAAGGPVIGSCNGFQVLTEAGMLPGALMRNDHLEFRCDWQSLRVERPDVGAGLAGRPRRRRGHRIADQPRRGPLRRRRRQRSTRSSERVASSCAMPMRRGRVTPEANPNGSERGIAGIVNERGNVLGLMPHPERAAEPEVGGTDGLRLFRSLERWLHEQPAAAERRL